MKKKSTWGKQYNKALNLIDRNNDLLDELVKDIVDLSFKPILVLTDGVVVHANNESVKLFGLPIKSLKGNRVEDLFVYPTGTLLVKIFTKTSALKGYQTDNALKLVSISGKECRVQPRVKKIQWKGKASLMFEFKNIGIQERADGLSAFSYDNLRQALLLAKLGTWEYDISDGKASVGQEFFSILGYNANDLKTNSLSWEKVLHPDSLQEFYAMINNLRQSKENTGYWEYKAKDSRNEYSWLMGVYQVTVWDANGGPLKIAGLQIDISEYKKCESEKNDALNIIHCFFLNSNDGVALFDEKGVTVEWNKMMEQITGIKRDKIIGTIIWDNQESLPYNMNTADNFIRRLKKTILAIIHTGVNPMEGKTCETTVAFKSGEIKYVQQSCFFIKQKAELIFVTTLRDITECKGNSIKIEKSEERLKLAISAGNVGFWDYDYTTGEVFISPMAYTIFGYLPKEIEPAEELYEKIIHPDDYDEVIQRLKTFFISGEVLEMELRIRKKGGEYTWIHSKSRIVRDEYENKLRATGTITDISGQKRIELELRQNKEDLTQILRQRELLSEISFVLNTNAQFNQKNEEVLRMIGEFFDVSRVCIFENAPEKDKTLKISEWHNHGIKAQLGSCNNMPLSALREAFKDKEHLITNDIMQDLPAVFADRPTMGEVKSFLLFPLCMAEKNYGYISLSECKDKRNWVDTEISLLKTISNVVAFSFEREASQKQVELNEKRYKELTEILPQIVFLIDKDGKVDFLNLTGCRFFGVTKEQVEKGLFVWDFFPQREVIKMRNAIERMATLSELKPIRIEAKTAENSIKPMVFYVRPRIKGGKVVNFSGIALKPE